MVNYNYNTIVLITVKVTVDNSYKFVDVKIENIEEFITKFLSHMFMETFIYGNIDKTVS